MPPTRRAQLVYSDPAMAAQLRRWPPEFVAVRAQSISRKMVI
jgi:hypothetical protein